MPQVLQHLEAVLAGQSQVQDHEVEGVVPQRVLRLPAIGAPVDVMMRPPERHAEPGSDHGIVFDQEDSQVPVPQLPQRLFSATFCSSWLISPRRPSSADARAVRGGASSAFFNACSAPV